MTETANEPYLLSLRSTDTPEMKEVLINALLDYVMEIILEGGRKSPLVRSFGLVRERGNQPMDDD